MDSQTEQHMAILSYLKTQKFVRNQYENNFKQYLHFKMF
jgi:hypothetical protein